MTPRPGPLARALDKALEASVVLSYTEPGYWLRTRSFFDGPVREDLTGRRVVVTGASSGLGKSCAKSLIELGADVILVARESDRARQVQRDLAAGAVGEVTFEPCDLSDLEQVRALGKKLAAQPLDALVHNAGVMNHDKVLGPQGLEQAFTLNVLAGFLLTALLEDALAASEVGGRVVHVTSGGMYTVRLSLQELQGKKEPYDGVRVYAQTKRAQVILNELWAERLASRGVTSNAMHPGWADTPGVERSLPRFYKVLKPLLRTPRSGADTAVWLVASRDAAELNGRLCFDREPRRTHVLAGTRERPEDRQALWDLCEELCGLG